MTGQQRIRNVLGGLLRIILAGMLFISPEKGYLLVVLVLTVSLILAGIRNLIYYLSMARHMVGGRITLFKGLVLLDFGLVTYMISDVPQIYVLLYLLGIHLFSGVIDVMHAMESKRMESGSWRISFATGIANILVAAACLFSLRSTRLLVYIYAAGIVYSAVLKIAAAVRRTAIAYIP